MKRTDEALCPGADICRGCAGCRPSTSTPRPRRNEPTGRRAQREAAREEASTEPSDDRQMPLFGSGR